MGIGQLGRLLDVLDQIDPGGGEAFVGLGLGTAFHQGLHHAGGRDLLAPTVEDLLLELGDQGIRLIAELNRELRHHAEE